ncbi:winged helix-turn-helix transcriptional regulator [Streptomyces sp. NPDC054841]
MAKGKLSYTCGLDAAVDVVGGKWKPMILWVLHDARARRFGELKRDMHGVSEKVLIQQLRELEADGIVHREVYREVPPRVEYSLTELGEALNAALVPLGQWGDDFMSQILANKEHPKGTATEHPKGTATEHPKGTATEHPKGTAA